MTAEYEPELGQMIFGQPHKQFEVPEIVEAALRSLDNELERVMWSAQQKEYASPFGNTGNSFKCATFEVAAYSWSDDVQSFNFKWRDVEISWYKWCGRGMSANKEISPDLASEMLNDCLAALRAMENTTATPVSHTSGKRDV